MCTIETLRHAHSGDCFLFSQLRLHRNAYIGNYKICTQWKLQVMDTIQATRNGHREDFKQCTQLRLQAMHF